MKHFLPKVLLALTLLLAAASARAQIAITADNYRVFDANGNASSLDAIVKKAAKYNVVFLGENHDDAVGHALQFQIFEQIVDRYADQKKLALSMEMFERDRQVVLDEYLDGLITEKQLQSDARPWDNYEQDYKPLVELAKSKQLPVIAANAPRRYTNMVTRNGRDALNALSNEAKQWLAPLPYPPASDAYAKKFTGLMGGMHAGSGNMLDAQSLWDATMAFSIAQFINQQPQSLAVHLNGKFHTDQHLGTVDQLKHYAPNAKALVISIFYDSDFPTFNKEKHRGLGDFVIITDPKVKRSFTR